DRVPERMRPSLVLAEQRPGERLLLRVAQRRLVAEDGEHAEHGLVLSQLQLVFLGFFKTLLVSLCAHLCSEGALHLMKAHGLLRSRRWPSARPLWGAVPMGLEEPPGVCRYFSCSRAD